MSYSSEDLKKLYIQQGIPISTLSIEEVKGYGAEVYITKTDLGEYVTKVFKDFQPYDTIPFYSKKRVLTEVEVYQKLSDFDANITPVIHYYDAVSGVIIMDKVSKPFVLFETAILNGSTINADFFINFAKFLISKKERIFPVLTNIFYKYEDVFDLRTLFVDQKYLSLAKQLFDNGKNYEQSLNLGGLSPKNMFIKEQSFKLIDFEEAFIGDYLYDPGFFIGHVLLYYISSDNETLLNGVKQFIYTLKSEHKFSTEAQMHMLNYAGLMLLHRASGFNLKGNIGNHTDKTTKLGEELLNSIDSLGLMQ